MSRRKVFLVGDGHTDSTFANGLLQDAKTDESVICDVVKKITEGDALNLEGPTPFVGQCTVKSGDYDDAKDADIAVITAGVARKPGMTRLDLTNTSVKILESIVKPIVDSSFNGILVVSINPVDTLATLTQRLSGFPKNKVIGTGASLSTVRLRVILSHRAGTNVDRIDAYVLGEHGDTSLESFDEAVIDHRPLCSYKELNGQILVKLETDARKKGSKTIANKGVTFYGIAMRLTRTCKAILENNARVMPLLAPMIGGYGIHDLYLGSPAVVVANGVSDVTELHLLEDEKKKATYSATKMRGVVDGVEL